MASGQGQLEEREEHRIEAGMTRRVLYLGIVQISFCEC